MKERDIFRYYSFGYNYYILRHLTAGRKKVGGENAVSILIDQFLASIEELELEVTGRVARDLRTIRKELENSAPEDSVDAALATRVSDACDALDKTLDAELQLRTAYQVTPKRFSVDDLL